MEQILTQQNNKVDAVLAMNDGMAGGVAAALAAQGMLGIPLSGQDGDVAALNRIAKGQQTVTVWKNSMPSATPPPRPRSSWRKGKPVETGADDLQDRKRQRSAGRPADARSASHATTSISSSTPTGSRRRSSATA